MPLKFERVDTNRYFGNTGTQVHYRDEFGQPRFFEFSGPERGLIADDVFGRELIQQVNELLARPRPSEMQLLKKLMADLRERGWIDV